MTHRQYRTWQAWLDEQWGRPSRSDVYAMQTACEVRRVLSDDPNKHQIKDMVLQFDRGAAGKQAQDGAERSSHVSIGDEGYDEDSGPPVATKEDIVRIEKLLTTRNMKVGDRPMKSKAEG